VVLKDSERGLSENNWESGPYPQDWVKRFVAPHQRERGGLVDEISGRLEGTNVQLARQHLGSGLFIMKEIKKILENPSYNSSDFFSLHILLYEAIVEVGASLAFLIDGDPELNDEI
jgi:hypothetical protein